MPVDVDSAEAIALKAKVDDQGNKVRDLKTGGMVLVYYWKSSRAFREHIYSR